MQNPHATQKHNHCVLTQQDGLPALINEHDDLEALNLPALMRCV